MGAKGFVVPPGGGSVLSMAPGRSAALKLLGGETGDSIMLFEETAPAGTDATFHLHHDSDEVGDRDLGGFRLRLERAARGRTRLPGRHRRLRDELVGHESFRALARSRGSLSLDHDPRRGAISDPAFR
jgi:hypothetical protein